MKVEDLLPIIKKELAKAGMVEHVDEGVFEGFLGKKDRFEYVNLRLMSYRKVDNKWHITAKFERFAYGVMSPTIVSMVIDDQTGEVSEMSSS